MRLWIFSVVLILLSLLDFITTFYAVNNGLGYEANPFLKGVVTDLRMFFSYKFLGLLVGLLLIYFSSLEVSIRFFTDIAMNLILVLMSIAVTNNILVILIS